MCGICGTWGETSSERVEAMVAAMRHRGPDDSGLLRDGRVTLGIARLAIIDMSPAAHQPMANPDRTVWIVYNGETFNFRSERVLLEAKGHRFHSASDTEVVIRMYEHYGDDFLLRLRGMFALAIYDRRRPGKERLLLARDKLGIKPLLFARTGNGFVFASELKALLASRIVEPAVDPVALRQLLALGSVYQPRAIVRGVSMLPPAHRLILEDGRERVERYWSLGVDRIRDLRGRPYPELADELAGVLEESVRLHLVSDVPLGAFLSGGVDSSVMVALMAREVGRRVKTFSVGFESEGAHLDETDDAERMARHLGTDHTRVVVRGTEVRDRIAHIARSLDQPSVDGVNSYFVSLAARQGVTVALSGTGGDEVFAGYPWFISMVLDRKRAEREMWRSLARSALAAIARRPGLSSLVLQRGGARLDRLRRSAGFLARYAETYQIFGARDAARVLAPELRKAAHAGLSSDHDLAPSDELSGGSTIERVTALCLGGYTRNQLLRDIDAVSMAHSLEVRVPYLDSVVVDVALSLPDTAKLGDIAKLKAPEQKTYRDTGAKRILIDVGRKFLPDGFDRQPKRGFAMPFDAWLQKPLREVLHDTLGEASVRRRGLLDVAEATQLKDSFMAGRLDWPRPWLLMMLELWCREVLDGRSTNRSEQGTTTSGPARVGAG
jgi:asparagine synthase (glutamine-hydrolysing)